MDTGNCVGWWGGGVGGGNGGIDGDGRRCDLGGEHTIKCTGGVLWNCACVTCIILLISVTPVHSTKKESSTEPQASALTNEPECV